MRHAHLHRLALLGSPIIVLVICAATASIRDQVGATNIGIGLAIVVVAAALVSRGAALLTAATAAIGFNYFHTQPYHSLRVHSGRDVAIVALLAGLGLAVSDISAWIRRREIIATGRHVASEAPASVEALLATSHPVADVWPELTGSILDQLRLAECRFARHEIAGLPMISRTANRSADGDDGFTLPGSGAVMPVVAGTTTLGYLVLQPRAGMTWLWVERRVVVALADHIAIALTYTGHGASEPATAEEIH